jgi:hypothetical protein
MAGILFILSSFSPFLSHLHESEMILHYHAAEEPAAILSSKVASASGAVMCGL